MEIKITINPDEAGHLAKWLRKRYGKSRKVTLGALLKQAGYEAASKEILDFTEKNKMKEELAKIAATFSKPSRVLPERYSDAIGKRIEP
jgi:hypothetical protein